MLATGPKGHPRDRPSMDELDIDGRSARPWCVTPSPARLRLALSTSGACDHMTVSLREPLAGYCGLPSFYLIRTEISSRQLSASFSRGFRRMVARAVRARSADQRGIDRFAGKSEIAEGRSDLRESVVSADLPVKRELGATGAT
jgi:hypothetical protein